MKIFISALLVILAGINCIAQDITPDDTETLNREGDAIIEIAPVFLSVNRNNPSFGGGFNLQYYISRKVNLNGYFVISRKYGYFNLGLIGVPALILFSSGHDQESESLGEFFGQLIMIIFAFENPSFHFPINRNTDLSVDAGLLKLIYDNRPDARYVNNRNSFIACYAGMRFNRYFGRFIVSPFGEVNFRYNDFIPRVNAGLYLGYLFPSK